MIKQMWKKNYALIQEPYVEINKPTTRLGYIHSTLKEKNKGSAKKKKN